ncbi:MAG: glycoside hydrolase family 73 protein [Saprospiraceae bacterium]|mgnify:CR=1 FL=1
MTNQLTTKVKHVFREKMFQANQLIQQNWLKLVIVCLVAFVIAHKDLNISLNLVNSKNNQPIEQPQNVSSVPVNQVGRAEQMSYTEAPKKAVKKPNTPKKNIATSIVGAAPKPKKAVEKKPKKTTKIDQNLANTFSNIGFILNSTYAKRNNIDPAIVAHKREKCDNYIKRYAPIAMKEMKKYGVPASITLAQGLLESNVGESKLATKNNNHFGIKCFARSCKKGHCSNYTDDSHKDFFRAYPNANESYRAHSLFLQKNRYKHLKKLGTKNYKSWAHGLRKAGYATDKKYAPKLIKLIEVLDLTRFDK